MEPCFKRDRAESSVCPINAAGGAGGRQKDFQIKQVFSEHRAGGESDPVTPRAQSMVTRTGGHGNETDGLSPGRTPGASPGCFFMTKELRGGGNGRFNSG